MDKVGIATSILTRAVSLDKNERYTESLVCYQEGISILLEALKTLDAATKTRVTEKTKEYMTRAEIVKNKIDDLKKTGQYREQIKIEEDATGFSYSSVFGRFLDNSVLSLEIDDPYIRSHHQCDNLVRFLEMALLKSPKLGSVKLLTRRDEQSDHDQIRRLKAIAESLKKLPPDYRGVDLKVEYSDSLHDREIRIDNGWVIKIGRGLDYFKPAERFTLGYSEFDFRKCRSTTIDVFHRNELNMGDNISRSRK